jgi:Ni,Fe-hydrogenase III large subunit
MPFRVPIGPYHPALEEPYKLSIHCTGEIVDDVDIEIGFVHRAIELLAQRRNYVQDLVLVERVCGICSNIHTLTFSMAAEQIAGIRVPDRARFIRTILAELERLHSHLLWAGIGSEDIGFQTMFMEIYALREKVMDVLESISGNRVNYTMNCIGGVNRDIVDAEMVLSAVREIRAGIEKTVIPMFTTNRTITARTRGVGVLTREEAISYGVVGPIARASGLSIDVRQDFPYAAYEELGFKIITQDSCDVQGRVVVRALEMLESCRLIEKALLELPSGPIHLPELVTVIPAGETMARVEAPRGEVVYYLKSDGSDTPARVKIRTPSDLNIPSVRAMARGQALGDMAIIQASVDPCCSCTDR